MQTKTVLSGTVFVCYDMNMNKLLASLFVFSVFAVSVSAYELEISEPQKPYDVIPLDVSSDVKSVQLGILNNYPVMYDFTVDEPTKLNLNLRQLANGKSEPLALGLMVVKQEGRGAGVAEVARFNPHQEEWKKIKDKAVGLTFWDSEVLIEGLESGEYKVEVSTPDNNGKYIFSIGEEEGSLGYFESISHARITQKFYGYSILRMLLVPTVYYPLGIILLLFLIQKTRKYRKMIQNVN